MVVEQTMSTLGQAALLLASVVVILAMVYAALWLAGAIIRVAKRLQSVGGRSSGYRVGGFRKW